MGLRGPQPTPTPILKARGTFRAGRRRNEPAYPAAAPACPKFLGAEAKAEWRRQVKHLHEAGLLQATDRAVLAAYCEAWGEFVVLLGKAQEKGYGEQVDWRLVNLKNAAAERLVRLAGQFGFSPAARVRLAGQQKEQPKESGKSRYFA